MKINTKQKKNDGIPAPQIRVRSNIQSGAIVNPQITDLASPINSIILVSNDGKHVYSIVEAPALL